MSRVRGVGEGNEDEAETLEEYVRINAEALRALIVPFRRDPFEGVNRLGSPNRFDVPTGIGRSIVL